MGYNYKKAKKGKSDEDKVKPSLDIFLIMDATRQKNLEMLMMRLA